MKEITAFVVAVVLGITIVLLAVAPIAKGIILYYQWWGL